MKQQRLEKYSERFDNDESSIGNPETWGKRVLTEEDIFNQRDIDAVTDYINRETSKHETLEEVAERLYSDKEYPMYGEIRRDGFINGAKWQSERSYSEEDMKFAYEQGARLALLSQTDLARHKGEFPNPEEWFNEFKNR